MTPRPHSASNSPRILVLALRALSAADLQLVQSLTAQGAIHGQLAAGSQLPVEAIKQVAVVDVDGIYQASYEEAFQYTLKASELTLANGKSLAEQLKGADGYSWWYYFRFMALYKLRVRLYNHKLALAINEAAVDYDEVHVFHASSALGKGLN